MIDLDNDVDDYLVQYFTQLREDYPHIDDLNLMRHVHKLHLLQVTLTLDDCIKSGICCLDCGRSLVWTRDTSDDTEMFFKCIHCIRSPNLLRLDLKESAEQLLKLIVAENIQLVSSALYLVLNSSRYVNPLSPPPVPDNPVDILCAYKEKSPNGFKFGGGESSIVIADLYEIPNCPEFAVLIVSDTEMVPTRYYLHAMHLKTEWTRENKFTGEHLFNELAEVGNMIIKPGSILVLGPDLQYWITEETYAKEKHNLKLVVPFDELTILDSSDETMDVAQNFKQILRDAVAICDSVREIFKLDIRDKNNNETFLREKLQLYLTSAIWMRFFDVTPFKCFLYHCVSEDLFQ
ncbi:hypothetical protein HA402_000866 [Bradysia odoriphaga]|nr:hypothetical protein HA402_000866 [Bradysia odoriphaga]